MGLLTQANLGQEMLKEKGITDAINISKAAGVRLVVAGNIVGADEWNYFFHEVQPLLNEENVNFVGQIDFDEKVRLLLL